MVLQVDTTEYQKWKWPDGLSIRPDNGFVDGNLENNQELLETDLADSGLIPDDLAAYTNAWIKPSGDEVATYVIPYTYPDGGVIKHPETNELIMWRRKRKYHEWVTDKDKYGAPSIRSGNGLMACQSALITDS